jgi:ABC-type nitrate/sulfonate/bicarbonate transport system ATPase subunit
MGNKLIHCEGLRKVFPTDSGELVVLDGLSFDIEEESFVTLLGPSGCGKSTLLNIMRGLDNLTEGSIKMTCSGTDRANMAYVFQTARLLPWKTILDNITFVHDPQKKPKDETREKAMKYLQLVGLEDFANQFPHQLSGGMQQRVGIARALSVEPDVLLMDEPFSHLDEITAKRMRDDLVDIWERTNVTIFFITHDLSEAALLSDRIILLTQKPAKIYKEIDIDLARPRNEGDIEFFELNKELSRIFQLMQGSAECEEPART